VAIITLTTDYGAQDHYVGTLKGVVSGLSPEARLVDITHDLPPHDIAHAAFVLRQVWPWFPRGTVHLVVVDPGVGTDRAILVAQYGGSYVVAPDNGVVSFVHREFRVEALHIAEERRYFLSALSTTFHGRDIMAPVAAHLAKGVPPKAFGRVCDQLELLETPVRSEAVTDGFDGTVLFVDRFGTLVTNVHVEQLGVGPGGSSPQWVVTVDDRDIGSLRETFASVPVGDVVALVGGAGYVEVAVNRGRAVDRFGRGPVVKVRRRARLPESPRVS